MSNYAAYCGLYCGACSSMIAHEQQAGVPSALPLATDEGEQPCSGCSAESQASCEFVICNKEHGTVSCAFCPEFPCQIITRFSGEEWLHHKVVLENLARIKAIGLEGWLREQLEYWKCPACGTRTQWYQRQCGTCGGEISRFI